MTRIKVLIASIVLLFLTSLAVAQGIYQDPGGHFQVPIPAGWSDESTPDHAKFSRTDPDGVAYVLAAAGEEAQIVLAALQILVDASLDEGFVGAPLQASPVPLESGTWTQRIYAYGEELLAAISLEQDGLTYLVLLQGTQAAYMRALNAAANQLLLGFEITSAAAESDEDVSYRVEEVTFTNGDITLAGSLSLPDGERPHPAVILISGSGAQDRDGANPALPGYRPLRWLADHLARQGLAVLRFDERGIGASAGDHASATSLDFADDNEAALRYLQGREDINSSQIGYLGHSEGSMIAGMVAARNADVAFVISMAGGFVPGYELLLIQLERIVRASGTSEEEVAAAKTQQRRILDLAREEDWQALETFIHDLVLEQLQELPEAQRAALGDLQAIARERTAMQLAGLRSPWFELFLTYDPRQDWRQITMPVLALFGELDTQVDVAQNRPALEAALAGNEDVTVVVFESANHLFQEAITGGPEEYLMLEMAFLPGFLETISDWLLARVADTLP